MRRFIYLDTDTLNSYLAQIFDGLIQSEDSETQHQKKVNKQNSVTTSLAGKIALKLFGKGVDANARATYQHLKTVADDEMVRDVQTKIMHAQYDRIDEKNFWGEGEEKCIESTLH